jgi:hypothetical protein
MSSKTKSKKLVEDLTVATWTEWKTKMEMALVMADLDDPIQEGFSIDGDAAKAKQDRKARATLGVHVSERLLRIVEKAATAREAWDALEKHCMSQTLGHKVRLRREFFSSRMRSGESVTDHVDGMRRLGDQLSAVKAPVEDADFILTLLGSLPEEYGGLINALEMLAPEDLLLENVIERLLREEARLRDGQHRRDKKDKKEAAAAMYAAEERRGDRGDRRRNGKCYNCDAKGHFARDCPKPEKKDRNRGGRGRERGQKDKNTREARANKANTASSRRRGRRGSSSSTTTVASSASSSSAYLFVMGANEKDSEESSGSMPRLLGSGYSSSSDSEAHIGKSVRRVWQTTAKTAKIKEEVHLARAVAVDSGASRHMFKSDAGFEDYTVLKKPIRVKLGDDKVIFAVGRGTRTSRCGDPTGRCPRWWR